MKKAQPGRPASGGGVKIHDVLYVVFKHKWKILLLSFIGIAAAAGLAYQESQKPSYTTAAKLLVRYVVERAGGDPDAPVMTKGGGGQAVMDAEVAILTSYDLALAAAAEVGPHRILQQQDPDAATPQAAAGHLIGNLEVVITKGSNVIQLGYRHPDPEVAVEVLQQLIQSYFAMHLEIHRSTGIFEQVRSQTAQARLALQATEADINRLKSEAGVISLEETISELGARKQVIRQGMLAAQASLAEQRAKVGELERMRGASGTDEDAEVVADGAEQVPEAGLLTEADRAARREFAQALAKYQDLNNRLALLRQERNQLLLRRTPRDPMIMAMDRQIANVQEEGFEVAERHPGVASRSVAESGAAPASTSLEDERALLIAMEARVVEIERQGGELDKEVASLSALGSRLEELERGRQMEEEKYRYYQSSLEKATVDEALDPTKIPNISIVQNPSAPARSMDEKAMKLIAALAGGGIALGLALAFLLEFVVDRRVSRPIEIQTRLQLPLMMTIPRIRSNDGMTKLLGNGSSLEVLAYDDSSNPPPLPRSARKLAESDETEHFIAPYAEAIHDRILFNFEINNITHKPKLVGLTSLSPGAGASTLAAGLARAFADNGNLKVLLVDLNEGSGKRSGLPVAGESLRMALDLSRRDDFRRSRRNLYLASAPVRGKSRSSNALAPSALHEIMPFLEASDFDFIVFDMPVVSPTSPSLPMAGFMDKVLLVLDGENTSRESLAWAFSQLEKGRADVSCVFNKAKSHAPQWVEGVA